MAIIVKTASASSLLGKIKKAIDDKEIVTWKYDTAGDFTHTPEQWENEAWLRPNISLGELQFGLVGRNDEDMSMVNYGVYHGRFIEMLLTHFDKEFTDAIATALKTDLDNF